MKNQKFLTEEQLAALHSFVKSKYVEFYDVQIELVDHLASEIECVWEEDENVKFEVALDTVYKKFGIYGFSDITLKRKKAIQSQGRLLWWKEFQTFFKLPRLSMSVWMLMMIFLLHSQTAINTFVFVNLIFTLLFTVDELIKRNRYKPSSNFKISTWQFSDTKMLRLNVLLVPYVKYLIMPLGSSLMLWHLLLPICALFAWIGFFATSFAFRKRMERQVEMYPVAFA